MNDYNDEVIPGWNAYKENIKSVEIGSGVTSIGNNAFKECYSLVSANIPDGVTTIGNYAFYHTKLTTITIPSTVTEIKQYAFSLTSELVSMYYLPEVAPVLSEGVINGTSISAIFVSNDDAVTAYKSDAAKNNGWDEFIQKKIYSANGSCGDNVSYVIEPATCAMIISGTGKMADYSSPSKCPWNLFRSAFTGLVINEGVTSVGKQAFSNCKTIKSISLPKSLKKINAAAFLYCTALTEITIPAGVESIDYNAFSCCDNLVSVTLKSLPKLGDEYDSPFEPKDDQTKQSGCVFNLVLDEAENPYLANTNANAPTFNNVSYKRNFNNTEDLQALYLPFALNVKTDLAGYEIYEIGETTNTYIKLDSLTEGSTAANTPYFIKASTAGDQTITATNITISAPTETSNETTSFDVVGTYHKITYGDTEVADKDWYTLKEGMFVKTSDGDYIDPMRFYLTPKVSDANDFINLYIDEITHIDNITDKSKFWNIQSRWSKSRYELPRNSNHK